MKTTLALISFVGVDIHTNLNDILNIKSDIECEYGVLYSDSKSLTKHVRYPDLQFCKDYLAWGVDNKVQTSLHLCGSVIERYLNQDPEVMSLCEKAHRIQLNLNIREYPDYSELTKRIDAVGSKFGHLVILQQNKTKKKFMEVFLNEHTWPVDILFDGSGGFGKEISQVEPPVFPMFTGYAGGIKPENVVKIVKLIETANVDGRMFYIDMESGVRVDNIFSLEKCQQVIDNLALEKLQPWNNNPA